MDEEELFPTFSIEDYPDEEISEENINYPNSPYFDEEKGDFIVDKTGKFVVASEQETWEQWCIKACQTERDECLAYSNLFGAELEEVFLYDNKKAQESQIEKTFTEAILADPLDRTQQVKDFSFEWKNDNVDVSFIVVGTTEMSARLEIEMNR